LGADISPIAVASVNQRFTDAPHASADFINLESLSGVNERSSDECIRTLVNVTLQIVQKTTHAALGAIVIYEIERQVDIVASSGKIPIRNFESTDTNPKSQSGFKRRL
jgi:hypothetical protein